LAIRLIARALLKTPSRSAKQHLALLKAQPLHTLDKFADGPDRGVAATFLQAYGSLSQEEQGVLRALAACAQGTRTEIVAAVAGSDAGIVEDALNVLAGVSLAEFREGASGPWGMHDVVRIFARAQPESRDAEAAHVVWAKEHLRRYRDPLAHVEMENGIPEAVAAFERLLVSSANEQASQILLAVHRHLTRYGRYGQAVDLGERLLANLQTADSTAATWLGNLGLCYQTLGDIPKAIDFHERSLAMAKKLGALAGQAGQIGNLGMCYESLGNIPKAIDFHERSLVMYEKLGRLEGQANQLGNLGVCHQTLGDIPKAIGFHERSLAMNEKLGRLEGQANQLGNLGVCHQTLGDIPKAIGFHERSLAMMEKLGHLAGQANQLASLGLCYRRLGDIPKAIDFHERSLVMNEKLGRLERQAKQLGNLGICYKSLGDIPKSIDYLQRALALFSKMGLSEGHPSVVLARKTLSETIASSAAIDGTPNVSET
jgi:tetratricopeptide (TPR) repeat protein